MQPVAIRYVHDMDATRRFYEVLGLTVAYTAPPSGPAMWIELRGSDGYLALHHVAEDADAPAVGLAFQVQERLEEVVARLAGAGFPADTPIVDEPFGRSFTVSDPAGLRIQVNEHARDRMA